MDILKIKKRSVEQTVKWILRLMLRASNRNLVKITYLFEGLTKDEGDKNIIKTVRKGFKDNSPFAILSKNALQNLNPHCRDKLVTTLIVNWLLFDDIKKEFKEKEGFLPPDHLVISPTMRCNLSCKGCYAGEYKKEEDLGYQFVDKAIKEGKEMGIYFVTISGGEPFIWPHLFKLLKEHNDVYFLIYTNGTLINKKMAEKLAQFGNAAPAVSVEGFKKEVDIRRGKGVYEKVLKAMCNLKEEGVFFGFSATPTRYNSAVITSDEFIDFYIKQGCYFGWFFQYIPIGKKPDVKLMATPEQRTRLRLKVHNDWRNRKPIFIGDFWNDGPYARGCMAGGRMYLHINTNGDMEPCVFTHFASHNIKNSTIREAVCSDFFGMIRERLKKVDNWLMPCIIIDNPEILREVCRECDAKPSHVGAETIIQNKSIIEHLDNYSKKMHQLSDKNWEKDYKEYHRT